MGAGSGKLSLFPHRKWWPIEQVQVQVFQVAGMCGRNSICIFGKLLWVRSVEAELAVETR